MRCPATLLPRHDSDCDLCFNEACLTSHHSYQHANHQDHKQKKKKKASSLCFSSSSCYIILLHHIVTSSWVPPPKVAAWPFAGRSISISTTCIARCEVCSGSVYARMDHTYWGLWYCDWCWHLWHFWLGSAWLMAKSSWLQKRMIGSGEKAQNDRLFL